MSVETPKSPPASPKSARRKHRRRLERNPRARVILGDPDRELFKLFRFFRIVTLELVQQLVAIQPRRIRQLYDDHYLARPPAQELVRQSRRGRAPDIYALGNRGAAELRRLGFELPATDYEQDAKDLKPLSLEHMLATSAAVTRFLVALRRDDSPLTLERLYRDGELRLSTRYFDGERELTYRGKPDTTLVLRQEDNERLVIFLEIDRGTASHERTDLVYQSSFLRKCRLYNGLWHDPASVRSKLGSENFYVFTITKSLGDSEALRRVAATVDREEAGIDIFWFTTLELVLRHDPLRDELWTTPTTDEPGAFL